jgi:hypothetical protein
MLGRRTLFAVLVLALSAGACHSSGKRAAPTGRTTSSGLAVVGPLPEGHTDAPSSSVSGGLRDGYGFDLTVTQRGGRDCVDFKLDHSDDPTAQGAVVANHGNWCGYSSALDAQAVSFGSVTAVYGPVESAATAVVVGAGGAAIPAVIQTMKPQFPGYNLYVALVEGGARPQSVVARDSTGKELVRKTI